ncbi:MAG TPA: Uma2 family endonuclease [Kofleriaceae bacterium]|nr:Uma2 family endonuclease [Kofleriaceae bacterium]
MSSPSNADTELPAVDEHIVVPDAGYEIDDGKIILVPPAEEPHANRNSKLAALLEIHAADDFDVAVDMLTRISANTDRAPDASVYPIARDPRTGGRQLEHLAFEIVSTESLDHAAGKARGLAGRGVRRVFAIDVESARVFEWSRELDSWSILDVNAAITDPALAVPLPVGALLCTDKADDAVAAALLAKRNPVIEAALRDAAARGTARRVQQGASGLLLGWLRQRFGDEVDTRVEQRLATASIAQLEVWATRVLSAASLTELLVD